LAGNGGRTIADEMEEIAVNGSHRIEVREAMAIRTKSCW